MQFNPETLAVTMVTSSFKRLYCCRRMSIISNKAFVSSCIYLDSVNNLATEAKTPGSESEIVSSLVPCKLTYLDWVTACPLAMAQFYRDYSS